MVYYCRQLSRLTVGPFVFCPWVWWQPHSWLELKAEVERTMVAHPSLMGTWGTAASSVPKLPFLLFKKHSFKLGGFLCFSIKPAWTDQNRHLVRIVSQLTHFTQVFCKYSWDNCNIPRHLSLSDNDNILQEKNPKNLRKNVFAEVTGTQAFSIK